MSVEGAEAVRVKEEPEWESEAAGLHADTQEAGAQAGHLEHEVKGESRGHEQGACGVSVSAGAGLHTDTQEAGAHAGHIKHVVKDEPESVAGTQAIHIEHEIKVEPGAYEESAAAALAALYQDHVVKGELVVGPKELHRPNVALVHPASLSTAERSAVAGKACSVRLEHMRVDRKRRACRIGPHTYKLRSCLDSPRDSNTRKKTNRSKNKLSSQVSALPFIQFAPDHQLCSRKSDARQPPLATSAGSISEEEEIDVVSLSTWQPPLAATHLRTDSLARVPSAQERQHIQRTATSPRQAAPAAMAAAALRRSSRIPGRRRSNTDTDSEAEALEMKRRSIHKFHNDMERRSICNDKERRRRIGLKNLFDELKEQIPATRDKESVPKVVVLREAVFLCRRLRDEHECLRKQQNKLLTKLKKLRKMVASRYIRYKV